MSLFLPHLSMLQVIRSPVIPEWAAQQFHAWRVIEGQERTDRINLSLKGYREFAFVHGENALLASISHDHIARDTLESRFLIQSELKGTAADVPHPEEELLYEACVFLELARDLDEKNMELEGGFNQIEGLEKEFRTILGIASEEEILEAEGSLSPPLTHERSHLSFMLSKRISSWFRSFSAHPAESSPVLVAIIPEAMEYALEPVRTECERMGHKLEASKYSLVSAPSLADLDSETFATLMEQLKDSGVLQTYWQSLDQVMNEPGKLAQLEELRLRAHALEKDVEAFCGKHLGRSVQKEIHLSLYLPSVITINDIWTNSDREGCRTLGKDSSFLKCPPVFLCLA